MSRFGWFPLVLLLPSPVCAAEIKDLDAFLNEVREHGYLNVPPDHGRFLQLVTEQSGAKRVLEVGTSNGYSGLWIARGLRRTGGKLITVEIDEGRATAARENFKKAGFDDIITLHRDDAFKIIPKLEGEFDMVFLDAGNFKAFLDLAAPKLRPGGVLLTHNALLLRTDTQKAIDALKDDPQWLTSVVQIGDDGFLICHKRRPAAAPAVLDPAALVTDGQKLVEEKFPWGTIKWVCSGKLIPGARQTVGVTRILPGQKNPMHYHPNCEEVLYMLAGQGRHTLDDRAVDLKAGMTIRIPAGVKHNLTNTGTEPLMCLVTFSTGERQAVFLK
jgi:predicted O-methyltransferase YrrM/mannose-6-phosphate isomerase-like protein (cupin superfamily)